MARQQRKYPLTIRVRDYYLLLGLRSIVAIISLIIFLMSDLCFGISLIFNPEINPDTLILITISMGASGLVLIFMYADSL